MKQGDKFTAPDGTQYTVLAPLAYRGKEGCTSGLCTRMGFDPETGNMGRCVGWHCAVCDEPCSSQGHARCHPENRTVEAA